MRRLLLACPVALLPALLCALLCALQWPGAAGAAGEGSFAGRPVELGPSAQQPTVLTSGLYTFTPDPSGRDGYVAIDRTIPGSHFWWGVSALTDPADLGRTLDVDATGTGGSGSEAAETDCGSEFFDSAPSGLDTLLAWTGRSPGCRTADRLTIRLTSRDLPPGPAQLELWEEPPVTDESTLAKPGAVPWSPVEAATDPTGLTPGSSYADAPLLGDGTYAVHLDPGAPALFRVPLTWGQHAQVLATTSTTVADFSRVEGRWLTPLGGVIEETDHTGGGPDETALLLDDSDDPEGPVVAGFVTPIVAWRNRYGATGAPAAFAGDYYLALETDATQLPATGVDVVLTATTVTDFAAASPTYAAPPPPRTPVDGVADEAGDGTDAAEGDSGPVGDAGSDGSGRDALAYGLFGAAGLLALVGTVLLTRRRMVR